MIPTNNETWDFEVYKRKENSPYEYESFPSCYFRGRPANTFEVKKYRVQKGVNGNSDSQFVLASNLPKTVEIGDHIKFLGKIWTVQSIGYYFDASRIANPQIFSDEQIAEKCPKGLNLQ